MQAGARRTKRASPVLATGLMFAALWPGESFAQNSYQVGPPNEYLQTHPMGPVRTDMDADRHCLGGYNAEVPYATNTCIPPVAGAGFTMTRTIGARSPASDAPDGLLSRPVQVADAISGCWSPPAGPAREITLRVAFSTKAQPIGARITYVKAPDKAAGEALRASLLAALADCRALRFTPALGKSIAGRPFAIRFVLPARS